ERSPNVDSLGTVMHLVEPAPQERRVVHRPVPRVDTELERQETAGDLRPQRQLVAGQQTVLAEPAVPEQGRVGRQCEIKEHESGALETPPRDAWKGAALRDQFEQREPR